VRPAYLVAIILIALIALSGCQQNNAAKQRADELVGGEKEGVTAQAECVTDTDCKDNQASTKDTCNFDGKCEHQAIVECISSDGFCPVICRGSGDTDCDADECKSNAECNDNKPETKDECTGSPKKCVNGAVTGCISGDALCPQGCNAISDSDCKNLPPEAETCKTDSDCDDDSLETIDSCVGEPLHCSHKTIKNCVDADGVCPKTCDATVDSDCQDQCIENADCKDGKPETIDECDGHPKRCKNLLVTECKNGDGVCLKSCDESSDTDCTCENADGFCPPSCDFTTDDDCPKKNLCLVDHNCDDGLAYTLDLCIGTPKQCEHDFTQGSNCGALNADANASNTAADCFCAGYNECAKLGAVVTSNKGQDVFAYTLLDLDKGNCRFEVWPKKLNGKDLDPRVGYITTCEALDTGVPEVPGKLRQGSVLKGAACAAEVSRFFALFPATFLNGAASCRGNFTEYYASQQGSN